MKLLKSLKFWTKEDTAKTAVVDTSVCEETKTIALCKLDKIIRQLAEKDVKAAVLLVENEVIKEFASKNITEAMYDRLSRSESAILTVACQMLTRDEQRAIRKFYIGVNSGCENWLKVGSLEETRGFLFVGKDKYMLVPHITKASGYSFLNTSVVSDDMDNLPVFTEVAKLFDPKMLVVHTDIDIPQDVNVGTGMVGTDYLFDQFGDGWERLPQLVSKAIGTEKPIYTRADRGPNSISVFRESSKNTSSVFVRKEEYRKLCNILEEKFIKESADIGEDELISYYSLSLKRLDKALLKDVKTSSGIVFMGKVNDDQEFPSLEKRLGL